MKNLNEQLTRRKFLKEATQAAHRGGIFRRHGLRGRAAGGPRRRRRPLARSQDFLLLNGEIHVNEIGKPEGKPLTTGHMDFKPSWSKTGNKLVCFRRTKRRSRHRQLEERDLASSTWTARGSTS